MERQVHGGRTARDGGRAFLSDRSGGDPRLPSNHERGRGRGSTPKLETSQQPPSQPNPPLHRPPGGHKTNLWWVTFLPIPPGV